MKTNKVSKKITKVLWLQINWISLLNIFIQNCHNITYIVRQGQNGNIPGILKIYMKVSDEVLSAEN